MAPSLRSKANCLLSRPNAWLARPCHASAYLLIKRGAAGPCDRCPSSRNFQRRSSGAVRAIVAVLQRMEARASQYGRYSGLLTRLLAVGGVHAVARGAAAMGGTRSLISGIAFVAAAVNAALAQVLTTRRVPAALAVEGVSEAVAVCGKQGGAECELIPSRAVDNRDSAASIWMLTLALFVWFLIWSLVAALLATHLGWLAPAKALI
jgi:hypothetical protein